MSNSIFSKKLRVDYAITVCKNLYSLIFSTIFRNNLNALVM